MSTTLKKRVSLILIILAIVFLFTPIYPFLVQGATSTPLVPCSGVSGDECTFVDLVQLVQNFINFITFNLAFPVAAILFGYAGVLLMTAGGKEDRINKGKKIFWNVAVGLVIVLAAWLIVYTIVNTLVVQNEDGEGGFNIPAEVELNP